MYSNEGGTAKPGGSITTNVLSLVVLLVSVTTPAPEEDTVPATRELVNVMAPELVKTLPPTWTPVSVTTPAPEGLTLPPILLPEPIVMAPFTVLTFSRISTFVAIDTTPAPVMNTLPHVELPPPMVMPPAPVLMSPPTFMLVNNVTTPACVETPPRQYLNLRY